MVRQVEIQIEPCQVAFGLLLRLVDQQLRENHPAGLVMRMRKRQESGRPGALVFDLIGRHCRELFPRRPSG